MPYTLNKTNGTILTDILDGTVDKITTDLNLIGKNTENYGELFNENFVKLLENFSNNEPPTSPLKGQLWFDSSDNTLKIYNGNEFIAFARPIVSSSQPSTTVGDFWFNNETRQLFFNDGNGLRLAGPLYTEQQGVSGFEIATVKDITGSNHIIAKLKLGNILVGVFSNEEFTPNYTVGEGVKLASELVTGDIKKGFTPLSIGFEFDVTAARAKSLVDNFGQPISVDEFVKVTGNNLIDGRLSVSGANTLSPGDLLNKPLSLGWGPNLTFEMERPPEASTLNPPVRLRNNRADQNFLITVKDGTTFHDAVFIKAAGSKVGIFNSSPESTLDIGGETKIRGDLTTTLEATINVFNSDARIINFGGAADDITIGKTLGTTKVISDAIVNKTLKINGQNLLTDNSIFNLLNQTVQTINFGQQATSISIGDNNGVVTFRNNVQINGDLNITGVYQIDNIQIKNNLVASIGNFDLELGANQVNYGIKFMDRTTAQEDLITKKGLTLSDIGEIKVDPAFTGNFYLLNTTARKIFFGGATGGYQGGIYVGNGNDPESKTHVLNKIQTYKDLVIGDETGLNAVLTTQVPATTANIIPNTEQLVLGQNSLTIDIFGELGSTRKTSRNLNINASNVVIEGDLEIQGSDIFCTSQEGSIFNNVLTLKIGNNSANIIAGGSATITEFGGQVTVGSTGNVTLRTLTIAGKITGLVSASSNVQAFEFAGSSLENVYLGRQCDNIQIGPGSQYGAPDNPVPGSENESWWTTPYPTTNSTLNQDGLTIAPRNNVFVRRIQQGTSYFDITRTQFPVVIARNNLLVRKMLLIPNDQHYATGGLLFRNNDMEMVSTSAITTDEDGNLTVGGTTNFLGLVYGATATSPVVMYAAKINNNLEVVGDVVSTDVNKSMFTGVNNLTIGGALNSSLNLGGSTSNVNIVGRLRPVWKSVTTNYDAYAGDRLLIDTTNGAFEVRLPPNLTNPTQPIPGDEIRLIDAKNLSVFEVEVIRNGNKINGSGADLTLNTAGAALTLVYTGSERGWCYDDTV